MLAAVVLFDGAVLRAERVVHSELRLCTHHFGLLSGVLSHWVALARAQAHSSGPARVPVVATASHLLVVVGCGRYRCANPTVDLHVLVLIVEHIVMQYVVIASLFLEEVTIGIQVVL